MLLNNITFNAKFDCVICLDGELPDPKVFDILGNIPVLAADGAVFHLQKIGVVADKIIGDLDTFYKNSLHINFSKNEIIHIADQDTNDFEKVLKYAAENNYKNCLILGINGGEFEHSLNNWSVFMRYSNSLNLCIFTKNRYGFSVTKSIKINLKAGETVSIIPQPSVTLTTENLVWELYNETLVLGEREGARNCTKSENITLNIHNGSMLLFVDERLPYSPVQVQAIA